MCGDFRAEALKPNLVTYEMEIAEVYPFTTLEEVIKNTGYDIKAAPDWKWAEIPTEAEIKMIREDLDTTGDFTGWKKLMAPAKGMAAKGGA